ncbi:hypothetical protein [Thermocoleostomius sinensis]|uniref:Uncharacterized protein n=1 Tax=Thermocoleostomius sinensis A174 TaxID=2016057 RepID=A0A9E9C9L5_9CYAN|nr:hypothetical protein [Thermocoleostomius sinensis]WAL59747.1 hypothetical protein OXH18_21635 [Thermocoleostomius sinensis A174]
MIKFVLKTEYEEVVDRADSEGSGLDGLRETISRPRATARQMANINP